MHFLQSSIRNTGHSREIICKIKMDFVTESNLANGKDVNLILCLHHLSKWHYHLLICSGKTASHCTMIFYKYITDNVIAWLKTILNIFRVKSKILSRVNKKSQDLYSAQFSDFNFILPLIQYFLCTLFILLPTSETLHLLFPLKCSFCHYHSGFFFYQNLLSKSSDLELCSGVVLLPIVSPLASHSIT